MGNRTFLDNAIEEKLLNVRTAFIGKVLSFSGTTANVQPLGMIKKYGAEAEKQAPLTNIPVIQSARYKIKCETITYVYSVSNHTGRTKSKDLAVLTPLATGDLVLCVCCDRNISEARRGNNATPPVGHHSISDSVVVGIL